MSTAISCHSMGKQVTMGANPVSDHHVAENSSDSTAESLTRHHCLLWPPTTLPTQRGFSPKPSTLNPRGASDPELQPVPISQWQSVRHEGCTGQRRYAQALLDLRLVDQLRCHAAAALPNFNGMAGIGSTGRGPLPSVAMQGSITAVPHSCPLQTVNSLPSHCAQRQGLCSGSFTYHCTDHTLRGCSRRPLRICPPVCCLQQQVFTVLFRHKREWSGSKFSKPLLRSGSPSAFDNLLTMVCTGRCQQVQCQCDPAGWWGWQAHGGALLCKSLCHERLLGRRLNELHVSRHPCQSSTCSYEASQLPLTPSTCLPECPRSQRSLWSVSQTTGAQMCSSSAKAAGKLRRRL